MTARNPSWREIAKRLAACMYYHAFCDAHSLAEADPDACPHCEDRAAYRAYMAKAHPRGVPAGKAVPTVTLTELRAQLAAERATALPPE